AAVLHLGGIAINSKLMDGLAGLIDRAKARGVKVGWDTVVDLYGKEKAVSALMGKVDYITPSMKEAVKISGMASVEENLGFFRKLGAKVAIFLKNGANGSEVSTTQGSVFGVAVDMHMPSTTVIGFEDSTGAGDSYSAFIACAVASGWTPQDSAKGASVCGALTCERRGGASITETPEEAYRRKMAAFEVELAASEGADARFPDGIDETAIEIAAGEARNSNITVFVSQDFANADRCRELMRAFSGAKFVTFNQHTQLQDLPAMMADPRHDGSRKVLITIGLKTGDMTGIIKRNERVFSNAMLFNVDPELADVLRDISTQRSCQRGVLTMALLAAGIEPGREYKATKNYLVLKALLTMIFENDKEAEQYIANLINPDGSINVLMRFGYLIGKLIGPAQKLAVNGFTQIVKIFA
ncbi:MAG: carbohydrate kinase family protein, partial [Candidatus Omnitrophica bacterium]|nr:carbohydrate kinase family protein [Candidatus Omnitrophota bacterium]